MPLPASAVWQSERVSGVFQLTETVNALPASVPFVGPEAQERTRGSPFLARIGANESVFGPSAAAIAAMRNEAGRVWRYGDPENHDLRHAIARHLEVRPDEVVVGEGIDGLLGYLARMTVSPGTNVVTSLGAYPTFSYHVSGNGGNLVTVPYKDDHEDPESLTAAARAQNAALVYLANPDNPMGTWHDAAAVSRMIEAVPDSCLLVLDEAYIECAPKNAAPPIDPADRRVVRMRTFSKIYGMAGARVGYAVGHRDLIGAFEKVRNHFGMCRISQAGALAALQDQVYVRETLSKITAARQRISEIAAGNGLNAIKSAANFVAIDCGKDGDFARKVLAALIGQGVFVRMPFVKPQDRCIRVSAGTDEDLRHLERALPKALRAAER